ncbi:hypothetical protein [Desulfomonile tiedjei]|uniref:Uncharacterized protein n=1 Tax=Desulfomonile tiedjei (strain ATCC 49306 / DSM 6799 / DCB-1) TaxID=706587 RepID=I4C975_DESTA|nr:hypothetical protein [Desulfomonile tiedjei]AFM26116.1 hypothetical protein Desti_3465 [Desulfomonile tiedjei DSM 6799]
MSTNGFRDEELVTRRMKVGNEWQTRVFPVVGGRLRILHEGNDRLSIQTEIVKLDVDFVVVKAIVESQKGKFNGTGTASGQRDARLADSLVELAETRAIARALRFGGIGVEYTGAEEVSHVTAAAEGNDEQGVDKQPRGLISENNGDKPETNPQASAAAHRPKMQSCGNGKATTAQVRALFALSRKANYTDEDIQSLINPFNVSRFEDLPREAASQLIGYLQQEVAA